MHEAVRTAGVVIPIRGTPVIRIAGSIMAVPMGICGQRHPVLGGMKLTELVQDRLDHQPEHQQR